jgi:NAD(P)-dependent dehydrogenase (short-subunit alcohol dehydrogenase family)
MNLHLANKTAIVTGGSKGIGKGIAESLAAEECNLVICARHEDELNQAADNLRDSGAKALAVTADLTKDADIQKLVDAAVEKFGSIDILINNAGTVGQHGTFEETSVEEWKNLFELNLFAVVKLTQKVLPYMKKQRWGRIINISSENGTQPYPDMIHYNASKAALTNFSKALSKQYASEGILVNTVSPAFIQTPLVDKMMEESAKKQGISKKEMIQQFLDEKRPHIELKRPGKVEEVGPLVAFLCSDKASFIVGSNYRIDGGSVAVV